MVRPLFTNQQVQDFLDRPITGPAPAAPSEPTRYPPGTRAQGPNGDIIVLGEDGQWRPEASTSTLTPATDPSTRLSTLANAVHPQQRSIGDWVSAIGNALVRRVPYDQRELRPDLFLDVLPKAARDLTVGLATLPRDISQALGEGQKAIDGGQPDSFDMAAGMADRMLNARSLDTASLGDLRRQIDQVFADRPAARFAFQSGLSDILDGEYPRAVADSLAQFGEPLAEQAGNAVEQALPPQTTGTQFGDIAANVLQYGVPGGAAFKTAERALAAGPMVARLAGGALTAGATDAAVTDPSQAGTIGDLLGVGPTQTEDKSNLGKRAAVGLESGGIAAMVDSLLSAAAAVRNALRNSRPPAAGETAQPEAPQPPAGPAPAPSQAPRIEAPGAAGARPQAATGPAEATQPPPRKEAPAQPQPQPEAPAAGPALENRFSPFKTDADGFVMGDNGQPLRFGTQRQALLWIKNVGNARDGRQLFEVANSKAGGGFHVQVRAMQEPRAEVAPEAQPQARQEPSQPQAQAAPQPAEAPQTAAQAAESTAAPEVSSPAPVVPAAVTKELPRVEPRLEPMVEPPPRTPASEVPTLAPERPAAPAAPDPLAYQQHLPAVRAFVRDQKGRLTAENVGRALNIDPQQAGQALEQLAAGREINRSKTAGAYRRKPETGPRSLVQFLADNGGLVPHGDLAAMDAQRFVPGAGPLVRKSGMTLDRAREIAQEAGYLRSSSADATTTERDLLDAIDRELRGQKVYSERDIGDVAARQDTAAVEADQVRAEEHMQAVRDVAAQEGLTLSPQDVREIGARIAATGEDPLDATLSHLERDYADIADRGAGIDPASDIPFEPSGASDVRQPQEPGIGSPASAANRQEPQGQPGASGARQEAGAQPGGAEQQGSNSVTPNEEAIRRAVIKHGTGRKNVGDIANDLNSYSDNPYIKKTEIRRVMEKMADEGTIKRYRDTGDYTYQEPKAAPKTERTDQGDQFLLGDTKPVTNADRAQARTDKPLRASQPQKGMDGTPLFDEGSRDTTGDLFKGSTLSANPFANPRAWREMAPEIISGVVGGVVGNYQETGHFGLSLKWMLISALAHTALTRIPIAGKTIFGQGSHAATALAKTPDYLKQVPGGKLFHPTGGVNAELYEKVQAMRQATRNWQMDAMKLAREVNQRFTAAERAIMSDWIEKVDFPNAQGRVNTGGFAAADQSVRDMADQMARFAEDIGQRLVNLGMLDARSFQALRGQYLHRYYEGSISRSLREFVRLRERINGTWGMRRGEMKMVAQPTGNATPNIGDTITQMTNPANGFTDYAQAHEIADLKTKGYIEGKAWKVDQLLGDKMALWRDYTPLERRQMGEIRDASYRFARGTMEASKDLALGQMFDEISRDARWASDMAQPGWRQVPTTKVPGTSINAYGNLAGKWVHPEVLDAIALVRKPWTNTQSEAFNTLSRSYLKVLGAWKTGKTAYNPATHFNNIMGNVTLSLLTGDVGPTDVIRAAKAMRAKAPIVEEARRAGLQLDTEVNIGDELQSMERELAGLGPDVRTAWGRLADFFMNNKITRAYGKEDQVFKLAAYMRAKAAGASSVEAVKKAHGLFFDYGDVPLGVQFMRDAPLPIVGSPFVTYYYKVAPVLARLAAEKPHRIIAAFGLLSGASIASYGYLYPQAPLAHDEIEREVMQKWLQGKNVMGSDKAIRLPFNRTDPMTGEEVAMFLNSRYFLPGGDLLDVVNNTELGPSIWPQVLGGSPLGGNPFVQTFYGMMAGKDPFFNSDIYPYPDADYADPNAPAWQKLENMKALARWLTYQWAPPTATWTVDKLGNAAVGDGVIPADGGLASFMGWTGTDFAGRRKALEDALAGVFGLKIEGVNVEEQSRFRDAGNARNIRDAADAYKKAVRNQSTPEGTRDDRLRAVNDATINLQRDKDKIDSLKEAAK